MDNDSLPMMMYDFVPISTILAGGLDPDYLIDVIGILTAVGTERQNVGVDNNTKMNVIQLEDEGLRLECTLFGEYVDQLNNFLASGETMNTAVIVQFAKIKTFQEKINIRNSMICTKLVFKPDCEEAAKLSKRMISSMESPSQGLSQLTQTPKHNLSDDFLRLTEKKIIEGLKDCPENCPFVVFATVKHIVEDDDWWYTSCVCGKSVYPDSKMFFCEKCYKHVTNVSLRYKIKVRVIDDIDSATFVIFDRDANMLFNRSCQDMFDTSQKRDAVGSTPKEITDLVDQSFLFKVQWKNEGGLRRFDKSFRVKKLCNDESIINLFKEDSSRSMDVTKPKVVGVGNANDGCSIFQQDLMPKFIDAAVENGSLIDEKEACDLGKDSDDVTPTKLQSIEVFSSQAKDVVNYVSVESGSSTQQKEGVSFSKLTEDLGIVEMDCDMSQKNVKEVTDIDHDVLVVNHGGGSEKRQCEMKVPMNVLKRKIKVEKL